jgi:hypothetical protein
MNFYVILGSFAGAVIFLQGYVMISFEVDHWRGKRKQKLIPGTVKDVTRERPTPKPPKS